MHRRTRIALAAAAVPITAAAVLGAQVFATLQRDYLRTADFTIDLEFDGSGEDRPVRIAVLGDSLVEGVGASSAEASLAGQVGAKVAAGTGRAVDVRGFGVSGAVTAGVAGEQLDQVEAGAFDVLVLEIGSNDVTHLTRDGDLERHTRRMLERATQLAPIVVFGGSGRLDTPNFQRPLRDLVVWRATRVRALQERVADEFDAVDYMNVAVDVSPVYARTPGANSRDAFHPSDIGYEVWARPLAQLVVGRLDAGRVKPVPSAATSTSP
jgi:lysophospholipase L1-like esterase